MPSRLDNSFFEDMGFSITNRSMLKGAFRFLGLVSYDSSPNERLKQLVRTGAEARPQVLEAITRTAYAPLFASIDVGHASRGQLDEYLKSQGITGDMARKCWGFFAALAADAGIEISPRLDKANLRKMAQETRREKKAKRQVEPRSSSSLNAMENDNLAWKRALLEKFPEFDPQWPVEVKIMWFDDLKQLGILGLSPTDGSKPRRPTARSRRGGRKSSSFGSLAA